MVHIGIIPDGNRRWCKNNNMSLELITEHWMNNMFLKLIKFLCNEENRKISVNLLQITEVSLYVSSIDNLSRNDKSFNLGYVFIRNIDMIINNIEQYFIDATPEITEIILKGRKTVQKRLKINIIGDIDKIPEDIVQILGKYNSETKDKFVVNMAMAYDYSKDLTDKPEGNYIREQSDIDILFRSGGEQRLSGFFPTKTLYSELYFIKKLWPDVNVLDINACLKAFFKRTRRFGK